LENSCDANANLLKDFNTKIRNDYSGLIKSIAYPKIAQYTLESTKFQEFAQKDYFLNFYANGIGKSSYKEYSNINYHDINNFPRNWAENYRQQCDDVIEDLDKDLFALDLMLMIDFLDFQEGENGELNERTKLYRLQQFYSNWEKDFEVGRTVQMKNRAFISTTMPENGKTFLTNDELIHDDQPISAYHEMFLTINIPKGTECGVNLRPILANFDETEKYRLDQREVLIPPGTFFKITKVEKKGKMAEIEMTCLA